MPEIEPLFLVFTAHNLVTIPTELFWLPQKMDNVQNKLYLLEVSWLFVCPLGGLTGDDDLLILSYIILTMLACSSQYF
jgi:hypothetical protein